MQIAKCQKIGCIASAVIFQKPKKTFIAAPVAYFNDSCGFLNIFQQLDFLSLQGATMGGFGLKSPFMCNGANIAFAKADFIRLNGYDGNNDIASGDDVFLMQKFLKADQNSVGYLKSKKCYCPHPAPTLLATTSEPAQTLGRQGGELYKPVFTTCQLDGSFGQSGLYFSGFLCEKRSFFNVLSSRKNRY